ncbi:MAG: glutaredoxin family protein [Candidatus Bathyarchaeia archaeon]
MGSIDEIVRVYALPDCPKCEELKLWLTDRDIEFESKWFDTETQTEFIMCNMFGNPPILEIGNKIKFSEELFEEELKEDLVLEVLGFGEE